MRFVSASLPPLHRFALKKNQQQTTLTAVLHQNGACYLIVEAPSPFGIGICKCAKLKQLFSGSVQIG